MKKLKIILTKTVGYQNKFWPPGSEVEWPEDIATEVIEKDAADREFPIAPDPPGSDPETGVVEPESSSESFPDDSVVNMDDLVIAAGEAVKNGQVTQDGRPEVKAMEEILGVAVTAAQRDAAWAILEQEQD